MRTIACEVVVPEWATWIAQDTLGDWYAYEFVPVWNKDDGLWDSPDGRDTKLYEGERCGAPESTLQRVEK